MRLRPLVAAMITNAGEINSVWMTSKLYVMKIFETNQNSPAQCYAVEVWYVLRQQSGLDSNLFGVQKFALNIQTVTALATMVTMINSGCGWTSQAVHVLAILLKTNQNMTQRTDQIITLLDFLARTTHVLATTLATQVQQGGCLCSKLH